mgnify:CR=1 FL=1
MPPRSGTTGDQNPAPCRSVYRTVRYGRIRRKTRHKAESLYRLLSRSHPTTPFIVGIDAANLELTTPPEVFAPAFHFLRRYPIEARSLSRPWRRFGTDREVASLLRDRRLGLTYHVGEEFRHLLSGLRAIAEVLELLGARPSDRLGHAIAMALEPEVWARQTGFQAVMPKLEWLDTLVWVRHFLGPGNDTAGELGIDEDIQRLSRQIYGREPLNLAATAQGAPLEKPGEFRVSFHDLPEWNWSPLSLFNAWRLRELDPYSLDVGEARMGRARLRNLPVHSEQARRWLLVQQQRLDELHPRHGTRAAYHLLSLYWYHPTVRAVGNEIMVLDMEQQRSLWLRLCREVQEKMKREVERRQLIVEVNPSSNRLVGPLSGLKEHHVFRMTLDEKGELDRRLRVTVNTDDPGVFNTSLPHEYYLLGEILMDRGIPEPKVEEWLEWLRQNGRDSSFVRSLPRADDPRVQKILNSLRREHQSVIERMSGVSHHRQFWRRFLKDRETKAWHRLHDSVGELTAEVERGGSDRRELLERLRTLEAWVRGSGPAGKAS